MQVAMMDETMETEAAGYEMRLELNNGRVEVIIEDEDANLVELARQEGKHFYSGGIYPAGAVVAVNVRAGRGGAAVAYELPVDPLLEANRRNLERLARQRFVLVHIYAGPGRQLGQGISYSLAQSGMTREALRRLLDRIQVRGRMAGRDWETAVQQYHEDGLLPPP